MSKVFYWNQEIIMKQVALAYIISNNIIKENENVDASYINDHDSTGYASDLTNLSYDANSGLASKSLFTIEQKPVSERFRNLEDKLSRLEQQLSALNSLPPNNQLIEKAKESRRDKSSSGPILEVWQYTQLSKRLESNEEGLTKVDIFQ